jgi:hypothetical protein
MIRPVTFLLAFAGLIALVPSPILADIVFLEGGGQVEGVVTDLGSKVKIQGLNGSVLVRKSKIADHMKTPFVTEIYAGKLRAIDADKADDHYRLAMWCRRNGLPKQGSLLLDKTLELDPDHERARGTLGHVNFKGVWLTAAAAVDASMAERGFLRYQGRWYTEAGLTAYLDARREELKIEAEAERRRVEREALARKAREDEERLKLLTAERKMVEDALAAAQQTRKERDELLQQNRDLIDLMRDRSWDRGWYGGWGYVGGWYGGRRYRVGRYGGGWLGGCNGYRSGYRLSGGSRTYPVHYAAGIGPRITGGSSHGAFR